MVIVKLLGTICDAYVSRQFPVEHVYSLFFFYYIKKTSNLIISLLYEVSNNLQITNYHIVQYGIWHHSCKTFVNSNNKEALNIIWLMAPEIIVIKPMKWRL